MKDKFLLFCFVVLLLSACGGSDSTSDPEAQNQAPKAIAIASKKVYVNELVTLNGEQSSDPDGDSIQYKWKLIKAPEGSKVLLAQEQSATPQFSPDLPGEYVVTLVVSDAKTQSAEIILNITAQIKNSAPVAQVTQNPLTLRGVMFSLNGVDSNDQDGDQLTYKWTLVSYPENSQAKLGNTNSVNLFFTPDLNGQYVFNLVVNDGTLDSAPAEVKVTVTDRVTEDSKNLAPVALFNKETIDFSIYKNDRGILELDASSSYEPNQGQKVTAVWSIIESPEGSQAEISAITGTGGGDESELGLSELLRVISLDVPGTYVVELFLTDEEGLTGRASVTINATELNIKPIANAGANQQVAVGELVQLSAANSLDEDGDTLTYQWRFVSKPESSIAALDDATLADPSFTADKEGEYILSLVVNDGDLDSDSVNLMVEATQPRLSMLAYNDFTNTYTETGLPYQLTSSSTLSVMPKPNELTLSKFKLRAIGDAYTIVNLTAIDSTNSATASFKGLENNQVIARGEEVEFELVSSMTNGQTVNLIFSFEIAETDQTFSVVYRLMTN